MLKTKKTMQTLVRYGADPNHRDKHGDTPLMLALITKGPEVVEALLEAGANQFIPMSNNSVSFYGYALKNAPNQARIIEKDIIKQKDPLQYLINRCNNPFCLIKTIFLIQKHNPDLYNKFNPKEITEYLNKETIVGKKNSKQKISNFRKIIKSKDLKVLEFALSFKPNVTTSDIMLATKIFVEEKIPTTILEKMHRLAKNEINATHTSPQPTPTHSKTNQRGVAS